MFEKYQSSARLSCKYAFQRALPVAAALIALGAPVHGRAAERLVAFDSQPVLTADELAMLRGGFDLGNGISVNFGLEIQQFVNNMLTPVNQVNLDLLKNNFTVTQTTGGKTTTSTLTSLPQTFAPAGAVNNGATQLAITVSNQAIQSIIQNSANNTAISSVATLNVSTEGLVNVLRQSVGTSQMIQMMQMNSAWTHH
jgi:hypothetical protein